MAKNEAFQAVESFFLLDITFLIQKNYQKFFFEKIEIMIFLFHL